MEFRWLTGDEVLAQVNPQCRAQGWAELNVNEVQPTCRVLGAFAAGALVGWVAFQLHPLLGPLYVSPGHRDGELSRVLVDKMYEFLVVEVGVRGVLTLCENAASERLAQHHGMIRVIDAVYLWVGGG